jgi:hypothetical protein
LTVLFTQPLKPAPLTKEQFDLATSAINPNPVPPWQR